MHSGIKLRHIRAFLDAAEEGGIAAAARRQRISQPALSKTLAELEAMLGATLLIRRGRRSYLSPAGEGFRRHALLAVQELETAAAIVQGARAGDTVTIGALPTVAGSLVPETALEFGRRRPGTRISVVTGPNLYLLDRVRAGTIDLMIGRMPAPREMPGLRFDYLYEEPVVLAARRGHPLAGTDPAEALRMAPLILPPRNAIIRAIVDDYLIALGIAEPNCPVETVSLATGIALLEQSDMLWFISRGVIARELAAGHVVTLPISARFMSGAVGLTMKREAQDRPDIAILAGLLHAAAAGRA